MHNLHLPFVRDLFSKLAKLKVDAYETCHTRYFAFDMTDLIATHFIVGQFDEMNLFNPLITFKGLSYPKAQRWGIPFSGWDVIQKTNSPTHMNAVQDFFNSCTQEKINFGYAASLALCPSIKDRQDRMELVKMFESMIARFNFHFDIQKSFCIGRVKNEAYKLMMRVGYLPIQHLNETLSPVRFPQYANDEFYVLVYNNLTALGAELMEQYESYWNERITISEHENTLFHTGSPNHLDAHKPPFSQSPVDL